LILKLFQIYTCKVCSREIDVNSFRSGRIPELCQACKKQKELADLRVRQHRFYAKKKEQIQN
jgi:hypothetical protein